MKKLIIALSIVLAVLLGVCVALQLQDHNPGDGESTPTESTQPNREEQTATVKFMVAGMVYQQQTVTVGQMAEAVEVTVDGLRFVGWLDSSGAPANPFAAAVNGDAVYTAVCYPQLRSHVPFLFVDEENHLRPDAALTADELAAALDALASDAAKSHFPALPEGEAEVTWQELTALMESFFDAEAVAEAFEHEEEPLSRSAFAKGMGCLLGYSEDETIVLSPEAAIPVDVTADRADAVSLLQAAVTAEISADSTLTWEDVELPVAYEPGFVNIDGWLYYVQEDHYFLKDGNVGTLNFGADGRFTCGDAALDEIVAGILKDLMDANPEMERLEILREAYDYCHENFGYRRTYDHPAFGETGWEIQRASAMFEKGKGNCYSFAAIFWALSRGMGYETRAISGTCLKDEQPHSWCIIEIGGEDYFFDPEWQYAYHERGVYDKDMFMIPMDKVSYWTYKWVEE